MKPLFKTSMLSAFMIVTLFIASTLTIGSKIPDVRDYSYIPEKHTMVKDSMDSVFDDYAAKADLYLERFPGTPLTGDLMSNCARNSYEEFGIMVPLELALSQAQWESSMGRKGRSPVNNPFNLGESENRTFLKYNSTEEGVQAYYDLMASDYLAARSVHQLFGNFVNSSGHPYAGSPTYGETIGDQYYYIQRWLDKNYTTQISKTDTSQSDTTFVRS